MAQICRFYSISPSEVLGTDCEIILQLEKAIPYLEAAEKLNQCEVSDFPYLKKQARETYVRVLRQRATPEIMKPEAVELSPAEIIAALNG